MAEEPRFTPTQDLLIEVLAARYRLGHDLWPVDSRHRKALVGLTDEGYASFRGGIVQNTYLAWLTSKGLEYALDDNYESANAACTPGSRQPEGAVSVEVLKDNISELEVVLESLKSLVERQP